MQYYTTIEQSKKLVELGLNPETADMIYNEEPDEYYHKGVVDTKYPMVLREGQNHYLKEYGIPCWSLGALLNLMPKVISVPVDERSSYFYGLEWQFANDNSLRYIATNRGKCLIDIYSDPDIGGKSFIETAFEMVCWLLEKGYIKKGE